jgi:hypothetical protein
MYGTVLNKYARNAEIMVIIIIEQCSEYTGVSAAGVEA